MRKHRLVGVAITPIVLIFFVATAFAGVTVISPTPSARVASPVHFSAYATSTKPITFMRIYVDGISNYGIAANSVNTKVKIVSGTHSVVVQAWDSSGAVFKNTFTLVVPSLLHGREQLLALPFEAGVGHYAGTYGFTQQNYLLEGSNRINQFGSDSVFVYMFPAFRQVYPDKAAHLWPDVNPTTLTQLAQTAAFKALFSLPLKTFVITAYTFANNDNVAQFATSTQAAAAEEQEFYNLTRYLYSAYAGTGKTFILKHWEGDFTALQGFDVTKSISPSMVQAMINWLKARQRGVSRGRHDAGDPIGVGVFHAVEVNRIFDFSRNGLTRVINAVVPFVGADMVTYSSYDSSLAGSDSSGLAQAMNEALDVINHYAPDPQNLGNRRILVSEYGLFENELVGQTNWRSQTILQTSKAAGVLGAILWQVFDNECRTSSGTPFPVDSSPGSALRPIDSQCRGLWLVRPDGTLSSLVGVLSRYWINN